MSTRVAIIGGGHTTDGLLAIADALACAIDADNRQTVFLIENHHSPEPSPFDLPRYLQPMHEPKHRRAGQKRFHKRQCR